MISESSVVVVVVVVVGEGGERYLNRFDEYIVLKK